MQLRDVRLAPAINHPQDDQGIPVNSVHDDERTDDQYVIPGPSLDAPEHPRKRRRHEPLDLGYHSFGLTRCTLVGGLQIIESSGLPDEPHDAARASDRLLDVLRR